MGMGLEIAEGEGESWLVTLHIFTSVLTVSCVNVHLVERVVYISTMQLVKWFGTLLCVKTDTLHVQHLFSFLDCLDLRVCTCMPVDKLCPWMFLKGSVYVCQCHVPTSPCQGAVLQTASLLRTSLIYAPG